MCLLCALWQGNVMAGQRYKGCEALTTKLTSARTLTRYRPETRSNETSSEGEQQVAQPVAGARAT